MPKQPATNIKHIPNQSDSFPATEKPLMDSQRAVITAHLETKKRVVKFKPHDTVKGAIQTIEQDKVLALAQALEATGMTDVDAANAVLSQLLTAQPGAKEGDVNGTVALLHGIGAQNPMEGIIATQMVTAHNLAMQFAGRAIASENHDSIDRNVNRAAKLMRLFTAHAETLYKLRHGGKQVVQLQHVQVNEGGQAIVGAMTQGRGG